MTSPIVVITDADLPVEPAAQALLAAGFDVQQANCRSADDIVDVARDATALVVQWAPVTAEVLDALPHLRVVSRLGIGYDMIDVAAATHRGVAVTNTPSYCIQEVAAHTVALILATTRGLFDYDDQVKSGGWAATDAAITTRRPSATTVAVVGFGRIGQVTARHCRHLGYRVLVSDPMVDPRVIIESGHVPMDLSEALAQADVVTLHAPLTEKTRHLIDRDALKLTRRRPILINTCRGGLIDEAALVEALDTGLISGAALDVLEAEPLAKDNPLGHHPRVRLTPHAAWYSPEAMLDLPLHAAQNVIDFVGHRGSASVVNPDYVDNLAPRRERRTP